ncbi:hypothetical protein KSK55_06465 [Methanospirillum purgamenti]|jgi:CHASE2 domain-containing sensor protein|nr:hypothetical protein [Methanospirillum hungatei]QXO96007.1 hypothetical protein KSK55_06465 [Methanospirillum hungatei]
MEACSMMNYFRNVSIGVIVIGLFILSWGIVWLGNDLGFWHFTFPFWPVIVILTGITILLYELKKSVRED